MSKLILAAALAAMFTAQALADDSVRVRETCTNEGCFLSIVGEESPCLAAVRAKTWESGLHAAIAVRNCLDREARR